MTKALVIRCGDPRLDAEVRTVRSIIRADESVEYRFPGPDGLFRDPERADELQSELDGIRRFMKKAKLVSAIAVVSHTDCEYYPVPIETHRQDVQLAAMLLKDRLETTLPVHALLAIRGDGDTDWIFEDVGKY